MTVSGITMVYWQVVPEWYHGDAASDRKEVFSDPRCLTVPTQSPNHGGRISESHSVHRGAWSEVY